MTPSRRAASEKRQCRGARSREGLALVAAALLARPTDALAQSAPPTTAPAPGAQAPVLPPSPYEGRPIAQVQVVGLKEVDENLVRNQLRTREGQPYDEAVSKEDVRRLYRLGRFRNVEAVVEPRAAGAVGVVYRFVETPIIQDVQVVGNRSLADQDIAAKVKSLAGTPLDEFTLGRDQRAIEEMYRNKGYYLVDVTIDQAELENGIVLFRVREGVRVKVTDVRVQGNKAFKAREILPVVNTKTAGILERGPIDNEVLDRDVTAIVRFYRDRGYIDARADRQITPSPDGKEAIITFVVDEGPLYSLRDVKVRSVEGPDAPLVLSREQVMGLMEVKPGDVYSTRGLDRSVLAIRSAYWKLGYADAQVRREELRDPAAGAGVVDLVIVISQGDRSLTGEVIIQGNDLTRQKVIRREVQVRPDRPLDRGAADDTQRRLQNAGLFDNIQSPPKVTIQPEDPANPGYRDVLVEVTETNTGSLAFGAAIGTDSGVIGSISLTQRNFDLLDAPESFSEFVKGQAFRGAGQRFNLTIAPGTEVSTYSLDISEPRLFDSEYALGGTIFYRDRDFDEYDEERYGGRVRLGRAFGDRWVGSLSTRAEWVTLTDIVPYAPVDVFAVAERSLIAAVGVELTRTTVPPAERFRPTRGTRLELGVEQAGSPGDFTFTRLGVEHQVWFSLYEDYLGRKGVLSFKNRVGYIPQGSDAVPTYERYYLGGRNLRGFDFRTVSPKGIRNDTGTLGTDPVGGTWLFFSGAEYEHPLWQDIFSVVAFIDSGTVTNDPGFSAYRVGVGAGVRLYIKQLGQAPLAFDFAYPVLKEDGDEEQVFSFSIDIPF